MGNLDLRGGLSAADGIGCLGFVAGTAVIADVDRLMFLVLMRTCEFDDKIRGF